VTVPGSRNGFHDSHHETNKSSCGWKGCYA
jgi:hypothetical protein